MSAPKPVHLGPQYAAQFQDAAIVAAYPARPPYPTEVYDLLTSLLVAPGNALDIGCGTGDIARSLARRVAQVDAIDISERMIAAGRSLSNGDAPNLQWQVSPIESAELANTYGLIVAGESLHWMDWEVTLPRLASALAPGASLVIVERDAQLSPWSEHLLKLITRYSTNRDFRPYDIVDELQQRGLFDLRGQAQTQPEPFVQSVEAYVESIHSRNGFSRDRMRPVDAAAFDAVVVDLLTPYAQDGQVELHIAARLRWGAPLTPRR